MHVDPEPCDNYTPKPKEKIKKLLKPSYKFRVGNKVIKAKGYEFPGVIVSRFTNTLGDIRYVVEMDRYHLLHIFNEQQLVKVNFK